MEKTKRPSEMVLFLRLWARWYMDPITGLVIGWCSLISLGNILIFEMYIEVFRADFIFMICEM